MAPKNFVANIASELSQLSQELEDRGSQISRLEGENARLRALEREVARLRAFEEENARLRALEGENARLRAFEEDNARLRAIESENARLRASLKAAAATAASNNPFPTTTTDAPGVESQSRVITTEDQRRTKDDLLDEACDVTEVEGARTPQFVGGTSGRLNNNRRMGRSFRRRDLSSDDEDPIPVPKKEKIPVLAATKNAATAGTNKRKRATESSSSYPRLSESLSGLTVDDLRARDQSLPTFDHSDSEEGEPRPAKKPRASVRRSKAPALGAQTPTKKQTRPPHLYTSLGKSLFQRSPRSATPPSLTRKKQPSSTFRYHGNSGNSGGSNDKGSNTSRPSQPIWPKKKNQPKAPSQTTAKPAGNTTSKRTSLYAEIEPFKFKFIEPYKTSPYSEGLELEVHNSIEMTETMSDFWKTLTSLRDQWEDQKGADWAWEVQKNTRPHGGRKKRDCVTTRLADRGTRWRPGDSGLYACLECAGMVRPCFTWVRDEDDGGSSDSVEDGGEEEFCAPKGEFWCLPVHEDDRRCVEVQGREIRKWINEGESSGEEDDSGEESEKRAVDEYDDDDSEVTSEESSGESSEELGVESSGDEL